MAGPIDLFDKSVLQSLSVDEAVWFDYFFEANISPMFYVETLADLKKTLGAGRTPEQEVGWLATKTPELSGRPNVFHGDLCVANLLGQPIEMSRRIIIPGGRLVRDAGRTAAVIEEAPEAVAFSRWQDGRFLDVERDFASAWRSALGSENTDGVLAQLKGAGISWERIVSLRDARDMAARVVRERHRRARRFNLMLALLGTPPEAGWRIVERWKWMGSPAVSDYAPYAAFVLEVLLFYYLAAAKDLISSERGSNKVDLAYLFYLPFCMVFTSSDRLHRRCAPLFLGDNQEFVWGPELKEDLRQIDAHLDRFPESEKEKGIFAIAKKPPDTEGSVVAGLWDRFCRPDSRDETPATPEGRAASVRAGEELRRLARAPSLSPEEVEVDWSDDLDAMVVAKKVRHKRGKWCSSKKICQTSADEVYVFRLGRTGHPLESRGPPPGSRCDRRSHRHGPGPERNRATSAFRA